MSNPADAVIPDAMTVHDYVDSLHSEIKHLRRTIEDLKTLTSTQIEILNRHRDIEI